MSIEESVLDSKNEVCLSRRERLDSVLRKSFELMTTLRTSADQIANLKPIGRRMLSGERSGLNSTKNKVEDHH